MKNFVLNLRRYFFISIGFLSYLFFVYNFFFKGYFLMGMAFLILFYIFIHFFFIEIKNYGIGYLISIITIGAVFQMFILGLDNLLINISIYIINIGVINLLVKINNEVNNRKKINMGDIFGAGSAGFAMIVAMCYAFVLVGRYPEFDLNCQTLFENTSKVVDFVSKPLRLSINKGNEIKQKINGFYNQNIGQVVGLSGANLVCTGNSTLSGETLTGKLLTGNNLSGTNNKIISTGDNVMTGNIILTGEKCFFSGINSITGEQTGIMGMIQNIQKNITQGFNQQEKLNKSICEYSISSIKEKYKNPGFKVYTILLIFFLLWPFCRIIFGIASIIGTIIFGILKLFRVYKYQTLLEEVQEIM